MALTRYIHPDFMDSLLRTTKPIGADTSGRRRVRDGKFFFESLYISGLPSNYNRDSLSPRHTIQYRNLGSLFANSSELLKTVRDDLYYRDAHVEVLHRNLGVMLERKRISPIFSQDRYRNFLLAIIEILFQGSIPESFPDAVTLWTDKPSKVLELRKFAPKETSIGSALNVPNVLLNTLDSGCLHPLTAREDFYLYNKSKFSSKFDRHRFRVEVVDRPDPDGVSLFSMTPDLLDFFQIIKPAHTMMNLDFVYEEDMPPIGDDLSISATFILQETVSKCYPLVLNDPTDSLNNTYSLLGALFCKKYVDDTDVTLTIVP